MRTLATALLLLMALVLVATTAWAPATHWAGAVRAFAEAALIGGLADWFAVTALFRHPLGLPIPHTAIVPRRKNEIGRALAHFIRDHFLVRAAVERYLASAELATRLGAWLAQPSNATRASAEIGQGLAYVLRTSEGGGDLRAALGRSVRAAFDTVPVGHVVGTLLEVLTTGRRVDLVIDHLVGFGRRTLDEHRVAIRARIHEQSPWWLPKFVDQEIYDKLMTEIERMLEAIASDSAHPARVDIKTRLEALRNAFASDTAFAAKTATLRDDLVEHPAVRAYGAELWERVRVEVATALGAEESAVRASLARELMRLGTELGERPATAAELDRWLRDLLLHVIDHYRDPLSALISETIESWDATETAQRIEANLGTDLQFIRVNGTLVGGVVGVALYLGGLALG